MRTLPDLWVVGSSPTFSPEGMNQMGDSVKPKPITYGAEDSDLPNPPAGPIVWLCRKKGTADEPIRVKERLWVDARKIASLVLNCSPTEVAVWSEEK